MGYVFIVLLSAPEILCYGMPKARFEHKNIKYFVFIMLNIYRITFRWGTSKDFEKMQIFDFEADHKHAKRGGVRGQKVIRLTRKTV